MNKAIKKDTASQKEMSLEISVPDEKEIATVEKSAFDIDGFLEMRTEFIEKVKRIMKKGSDYHEIQGKKSLAKGGAEKIASIFGWTATFEKDRDVAEAFGDVKGLISFVCNLNKDDRLVGQGRGAGILAKNAGDPNKTIKMAQKSAFIDAVLRASGLSDFFTQDLEDHPEHLEPRKSTIDPSAKQIETIQKVMTEKGVTEEMLIEEGFDLKNLTGGKEGTASELIGYLFDYKPSYGQTQGGTHYTGSAGLTAPTADDRAFVTLCKALEACSTEQEYDQVRVEIQIAKENKKIDQTTYGMLVKVAKDTVERLKAKA